MKLHTKRVYISSACYTDIMYIYIKVFSKKKKLSFVCQETGLYTFIIKIYLNLLFFTQKIFSAPSFMFILIWLE
jgi:hypothetical protein